MIICLIKFWGKENCENRKLFFSKFHDNNSTFKSTQKGLFFLNLQKKKNIVTHRLQLTIYQINRSC